MNWSFNMSECHCYVDADDNTIYKCKTEEDRNCKYYKPADIKMLSSSCLFHEHRGYLYLTICGCKEAQNESILRTKLETI